MSDFVMPSLGADMQSGTLLEWMVKPGDKVARGQTIAVVGTEKGEIDVEVWQDGVVDRLVVAEGVEVDVGAVLATILAEGEAPAAVPVEAEKPDTVQEEVAEKQIAMAGPGLSPPPAGPTQSNGHRIRVSPLARRLAEELGIDMSTVHGTGPHGAISRTDVENAAAAQAKATATPVTEQASTSGETPVLAKKKAK